MANVYYDDHMKERVTDGTLIENTNYYVDVRKFDEEEVTNMFSLSGMNGMFDWMAAGSVSRIRFTNYIGKCQIGGQSFNIQSNKFLEGLSGEQQLAQLLEDIDKRNTELHLEVDSPSRVARTVDWSTTSSELLHELNYFYHAFFSVPKESQIPWLFQRILANPHLDHTVIRKFDYVWNIKRASNDVARQLASGLGESIPVRNCTRLVGSPILAIHPKGTLSSIPLRICVTHYDLDVDTPENRFLKFLFEYIGTVCTRAKSAYAKSELIVKRVNQLSMGVRQILSNVFFQNVGRITQIPEYSTVLRYRHGHKELYEHYLKSRMGVIPNYYDAIEGQVSEIKNVATLYEIWCYYQVAGHIIGENCRESNSKIEIDESKLVYSSELRNERFSVSYNRTFTPSNLSSYSYSLTLRPDITVEDLVSGEIYILDAKYRAILNFDEDGHIVSRKYQSTDIHKMHTYVDAITLCKASFVLYVGDEFRFFRRDDPNGGVQNIADLKTFDGVGVVPLVPGKDCGEFRTLIDKIMDP